MELYDYEDRSITPSPIKYRLYKTRDFNIDYMNDPRVAVKYAEDAKKDVKKVKRRMAMHGTGLKDIKDLATAKLNESTAKAKAYGMIDVMNDYSENPSATPDSTTPSTNDTESEKKTAKKTLMAGFGALGAAGAGMAAKTYINRKADKAAEMEANPNQSTEQVAPQGKADASAADVIAGGALAVGAAMGADRITKFAKKVKNASDSFDNLF